MKRIPSNRMPKYAEKSHGLRDHLILALILAIPLGGLGYLAWKVPWYVSVGVVTGVAVWVRIDQLKRRRIAEERSRESLCTFARSFDYRVVDTWIIRAVYEQLQPAAGFPVRRSDNFRRNLHLDGDDIDEIAEEIAQRTGRPLTNCEQNPWYSKVETVADMLEFFMCQPKQVTV
jgi:hypothetical protein